MKLFDVAIIGASISGASLGACLGAEAVEVALIDKDRFPRRKACGEGLSNIGVEALQRMGLHAEDAIDSGVPYYHYRVDVGDKGFPFGSGRTRTLKGVGVERFNLDTQLVDQACSLPSVTPFFESKISGFNTSSEGYTVQFADGQKIESKFLVLADGANSFSSSSLGIPKIRKDPPLWGISFVLDGTFLQVPGEVVVLLKDGFEINCTPVSETKLNVTFLTSREKVKSLQDEGLQKRLLAEAAAKCQFLGAPVEVSLNVGPVNATRRPYYRDSVLLLGDTAETLDPIAGMGMTHGILMAEIAADSLLSVLRRGADINSSFAQYASRSEAMSRPFRGFTRLTASLFRSPARRLLIPALASTFFPGLIRSALDESWKPVDEPFSPGRKFLSLVGM